MSTIKNYLEKPIYLHHANRELHLSLNISPSSSNILQETRFASLNFSQTVFCNLSQVYEFCENLPALREEFSFLSAAGRFCAHSDFQTIEEFLESRREIYAHDKSRYPFYFSNHKPIDVPVGSLGRVTDTTNYIDGGIRDIVNNGSSQSAGKLIRSTDLKNIEYNEGKIIRTLDGRDNRALVFPTFKEISLGEQAHRFEGSIRRTLSALYVENYIEKFDAVTLWGNRYLSYYDWLPLLTGFNVEFLKFYLEDTLIAQFLRRYRDFGVAHRIAAENTPILSQYRQSYAKLCAEIDRIAPQGEDSLARGVYVRNVIETIRGRHSIRPNRVFTTFEQALESAGEKTEQIAERLGNVVEPSDLLNLTTTNMMKSYSSIEVSKQEYVDADLGYVRTETVKKEHPSDVIENNKFNREAENKGWSVLSFSVAALSMPSFYYSIPILFDSTREERGVLTFVFSATLLVIMFWFAPLGRYFRMGWLCIIYIGFTGFGFRFNISGKGDNIGGFVETGHSANWIVIICLGIIAVFLFHLDYKYRR